MLVALLLGLRDISGPLWIGAAYFTLRHVHVTLDWWMGLLEPPATSDYLRYQFFLPVMAAGPINRFQRFQSETASRRWSAEDVFAGAERLLLGAFQVVVLGGWAMHRVEHAFNRQSVGWPDFQYEWTRSLIYWLDLYFTFAGLTSMALGLALMAGLRLEENFNRPWKSRTLAEFWTRWHITLSSWCRDYVFRPVAATSRRPALGVVLSMLAMGLWHGSSAYWIGWGLWQGLGIVLTRVAERHMPRRTADVLGGWVGSILGPVSVLAWLTLSRPVLVTLLGVAPP